MGNEIALRPSYWASVIGRPFSVISSNPKYNADYLDHIIKTKWLKILNEKEKEADESCAFEHSSEVVRTDSVWQEND